MTLNIKMNLQKNTKRLILLLLTYPTFSSSLSAQIDFKPYERLDIPSRINFIAKSDFDNNGREDIAFVTTAPAYTIPSNDRYEISIYLQNTEGVLEKNQSVKYTDEYDITDLRIADMNNDNLKDIITASNDYVKIYTQQTNGSFQLSKTLTDTQPIESVAVGDLNNDNLNDIAVGLDGNYMKIYYSTGALNFNEKKVSIPSRGAYTKIEIVDINSDRLNDVVLKVGAFNPALYIFKQNANKNIDAPLLFSIPSEIFITGLAVGDVNHDSKPDVLITKSDNSPRGAIYIWHQNSQASILDAPITVKTYDIPEILTVADLDCDGKNEIIVSHGGWNTVSIFQSLNKDSYQEIVKLPVPSMSHYSSIVTARIGLNSKPDILTYSNGPSIEKTGSMILLGNANTTPSTITVETAIKQNKIKSDTITRVKTDSLIQKDSNTYRLITTKKFTQFKETKEIRSWRIDTFKFKKTITCSEFRIDTTLISTFTKDSAILRIDSQIRTVKDTVNFDVISDRLEDDILIYPNPCDGYFYVKKINPNLKKRINLVIHAINGQFIKEVQFFDTLKDIDIQDLAGGAYMLTIIYGDRAFHKLLINTP
jgi:hypothetical protein